MINLFRVAVEDNVAHFMLHPSFDEVNREKEGQDILLAHQSELLVIANELLTALKEGAKEIEEDDLDWSDDWDFYVDDEEGEDEE